MRCAETDRIGHAFAFRDTIVRIVRWQVQHIALPQQGLGDRQRGAHRRMRRRLRHLTGKVLLAQGARALHEVAEVVGELDIDAGDDGGVAHRAVAAEGFFAQQEEADLVQAVDLRQFARVDDVAEGFGHLLPVHHPPAVGGDALRRRDAGGRLRVGLQIPRDRRPRHARFSERNLDHLIDRIRQGPVQSRPFDPFVRGITDRPSQAENNRDLVLSDLEGAGEKERDNQGDT